MKRNMPESQSLNARLMNFVEIHSAKDIIGSEDDPFNFDGDVSPTKDKVDTFISDRDKSLIPFSKDIQQ